MYFDDIKLNTTVDIPPAVIDRDKMIAFAEEYDSIPLHMDEEYAANSPFGALIAPGVMSFMAVWNNFLKMDVFEGQLLVGKSTSMEWLKPVYAGDVLTGQAVFTKLTPRNAKNGTAEITVYIHNQKGELVLTDVTELVIKRRPQENA